MMYYRQALELQCFLDMAEDRVDINHREETPFATHPQAVADIKFTYVVSCQVYGAQKKSREPRDQSCYQNILNLMLLYPSLRIAYIVEREATLGGYHIPAGSEIVVNIYGCNMD